MYPNLEVGDIFQNSSEINDILLLGNQDNPALKYEVQR